MYDTSCKTSLQSHLSKNAIFSNICAHRDSCCEKGLMVCLDRLISIEIAICEVKTEMGFGPWANWRIKRIKQLAEMRIPSPSGLVLSHVLVIFLSCVRFHSKTL